MHPSQVETPYRFAAGRSVLATLAVAAFTLCAAFAEQGTIVVPLSVTAVSVCADADGTTAITSAAPGPHSYIQWLGSTGEPQLPYQVMTLLLPPDVDLHTVNVRLAQATFGMLAGAWSVPPVPPPATWHEGEAIVQWPADRNIVDGRDVDIYANAAIWPPEDAQLLATGQLRQWRLAQVAIPLLKYAPQRQTLYHLRGGQLVVTFSRETAPSREQAWSDTVATRGVQRLAANFEQQAASYAAPTTDPLTRGGTSYVIITTSAIEAGSTQLAAFVAHKQSLGFDVPVITETDFGGGTGDAAAENIRAWLQANYVGDQIEYVLLIGEPDPTTGAVPMKRLNPSGGAGDDHPSDYYYADLTGDWDLDNDGHFGEYVGDFGAGGVDRYAEVLVGRIPYYGDIGELDDILAKTIAYEDAADPTWRRNVLLPMRPSDIDTPGYHLGEAIKDDLLIVKDWPYHRVYDDDFGLTPAPETIPCTYTNVSDVWSTGTFGLVVWWSHGGISFADQIMDTSHALSLNDNYPAFTFQASCGNAYPEQSNNLAYRLLENGGIVTIGATRDSWYVIGQTQFANSPSNAGMAYEYAARVVGARATGGFALHDIKERLYPTQLEYWKNYVAFNIYGDPSLTLLPLEERRYVDAAAPAGGDGQSWETAYADLQDALSDVPIEIWVATGTYKPDRDSGDRTFSFQLVNGVEIYGGFAGDETTLFQRDPETNLTVLSGDLNGDDAPEFVNHEENSYHVVTGRNTDATAVLDGFIIRGGTANYSSSNGNGGGLYIETSGSPTIRNCVFEDNLARYGGGAYCSASSNPTFVNCIFRANLADVYGSGEGGGLRLNNQSNPSLYNCLFIGNRAASSGGGLFYRYGTVPTLTNCTFVMNHATNGGGVYGNNSSTEFFVNNSVFWGNTRYLWGEGDVADEMGQIMNCGGIDINYSCVQEWSGTLGGVGNIGDDPLLVDPDGPDDILATADDDVRLGVGSPCVDVGDNAALPTWLLIDAAGEPRIQNGIVDMGAFEQGSAPAMPGDCDGDDDVDADDMAELAGCMNGPAAPPAGACDCADLDNDGDVDLADFVALQQACTGPGQ